MTPEMRAALKDAFAGHRIVVSDKSLVTKDPWAKQVVIMLEVTTTLYVYHVPTFELPALAWSLVRAYGWAGFWEWLWIKILRPSKYEAPKE